MLTIQDIIRKKRDKQTLKDEEIQYFIQGVHTGKVCDTQLAAWCMAVFIQDLNVQERAALCRCLSQLGERLDWQDMPGPVLSQQSTGGVGDISLLLLAPILAACGAYVPITLGAALAHTSSSIDRLAAIPGMKTHVNRDELKHIVKNVGCAVVAQAQNQAHPNSIQLTPLNHHLDEVRVHTGTVASSALMSAMLLSTSLAAGVKRFLVDIKLGNGAFIHTFPRAESLAQGLVALGEALGIQVATVISDLNQPIGQNLGQALEIAEAVRLLRGERVSSRLQELVFRLAVEALQQSALVRDADEAQQKVKQALSSGRAAERFDHMIIAQGGPDQFCDTYKSHLRRAPVIKPLLSPVSGHIQRIDTRALGRLVLQLNEHNQREDTGLSEVLPVGTYIQPNQPLVTIHAADESAWEQAASAYLSALSVGEDRPVAQHVLHQTGL